MFEVICTWRATIFAFPRHACAIAHAVCVSRVSGDGLLLAIEGQLNGPMRLSTQENGQSFHQMLRFAAECAAHVSAHDAQFVHGECEYFRGDGAHYKRGLCGRVDYGAVLGSGFRKHRAGFEVILVNAGRFVFVLENEVGARERFFDGSPERIKMSAATFP